MVTTTVTYLTHRDYLVIHERSYSAVDAQLKTNTEDPGHQIFGRTWQVFEHPICFARRVLKSKVSQVEWRLQWFF
jgi:hypothetical protein